MSAHIYIHPRSYESLAALRARFAALGYMLSTRHGRLVALPLPPRWRGFGRSVLLNRILF